MVEQITRRTRSYGFLFFFSWKILSRSLSLLASQPWQERVILLIPEIILDILKFFTRRKHRSWYCYRYNINVYPLDLYMVHATCISTFIECLLLFNIRCMIISSWSNSRDDNGIGFPEYLPASPQIGRDWYKDKWVLDRFVKFLKTWMGLGWVWVQLYPTSPHPDYA